MYLNRLFFRKNTGILICRNYMNDGGTEGFVSLPSVEDDFKSLAALQEYLIDAVEVVEISENDIDTQNKLNTCISIKMDTTTKELVFSFTSPEASLEEVKTVQKSLIDEACKNALLGGFTSKAHKVSDGTYPEALYGSDQEDQNNILGNAFAAESKLGGNPICKDDTFVYHVKGGDYEEWQPLECIQLAKDWKDFKTQQLLKNKQLQAYIDSDSLTTIEEVQKVTWDTVIPAT